MVFSTGRVLTSDQNTTLVGAREVLDPATVYRLTVTVWAAATAAMKGKGGAAGEHVCRGVRVTESRVCLFVCLCACVCVCACVAKCVDAHIIIRMLRFIA